MTQQKKAARRLSTAANQQKQQSVFWQLEKRGRIGIVLFFIALASLFLGYRIIDLQLSEQDFLQSQGDRRTIRYESVAAHRGIIFDRNGEALAVSAPVTTIGAQVDDLFAAPERWVELAQALGESVDALSDKITKSHAKNRGYIYLKRQMSPAQGEKVLTLKVPGIRAEYEQRRYYPEAEVSAHVVGFTNIDEKGQEGIELAFNEWLTGKPGKQRVSQDRRGGLARPAELVKSAEPGKELRLSLDSRIQYIAYRELKAAVEKYKAKAGSVVVLDVHTGEVLAMVNQPAYNPNNRADLQANKIRNRVVTDNLEPGSTLKTFAMLAALESGKYQWDAVVDTSPGYIKLGKYQVKDPRNLGKLSLTEILRKSSNVGISKITLDIGHEAIIDLLVRFGFGQSTGTGFPGESSGYLPIRTRWSDIETATLSFGYGLTVTPLQLAQAYMIIGAGGIARPLSLIRRDVVPEGTRVLDESIAKQMLTMLKAVIQGSLTSKAKIDGFEVGGKTGTARKVGPQGYLKNRYTAMFAGLAPIDNPRIAMVVIIDDPIGTEYYGGQTAAPAFSGVAANALRILGEQPSIKNSSK